MAAQGGEERRLVPNQPQPREDSSTTSAEQPREDSSTTSAERIDYARHVTTGIFCSCFVVTLVVGGVFYHKGKQEAYPAIFSSALCVFSVIFGTILTRLILVFTEMWRAWRQRRRGDRSSNDGRRSKTAIFCACFSGVQWWAVFLVAILAAMIIGFYIQSVQPKFQWEYITLVVSSVGLGPFISLALKLDNLTPFQKDKIVQERKATVANVLAWSYYYLYLDNIKHVWPWDNSNINKNIGLSVNKIFILIPQECHVLKDDMYDDSRFRKIDKFEYEKDGDFAGFVDKVVVKVNDKEWHILVHRALPLHCILQMSKSKKAPVVEDAKQEAKLFYEKIKKIMADEFSAFTNAKYHLVWYKDQESLMHEIETAIDQEHKRVSASSRRPIPESSHTSQNQDDDGTPSNNLEGEGILEI